MAVLENILHTARVIKQTQDALSRRRVVLLQENHEAIAQIHTEISLLDEEMRVTKRRMRKLIHDIRKIAKKEQLATVNAKAERYHPERMIRKKEIKKIISSSCEKAQ